jgi:hypothetical protein
MMMIFPPFAFDVALLMRWRRAITKRDERFRCCYVHDGDDAISRRRSRLRSAAMAMPGEIRVYARPHEAFIRLSEPFDERFGGSHDSFAERCFSLNFRDPDVLLCVRVQACGSEAATFSKMMPEDAASSAQARLRSVMPSTTARDDAGVAIRRHFRSAAMHYPPSTRLFAPSSRGRPAGRLSKEVRAVVRECVVAASGGSVCVRVRGKAACWPR